MDIIGNEQIKKYFKNIILNSKVPHSFILDAPSGMGKKLLGNFFAKTLMCEKGGVTPCNTCLSCRVFTSGNHPDVFYLKPSGKNIKVDEIRDGINKPVSKKPYKYPYKIFLIESADKMNQAAQNAFLKTLEEPPVYAKFILLSENYNEFLPTILSRCVLLKLKPLSDSLVSEYLQKNENADKAKADFISSLSGGNIGRAKHLYNNQEFLDMKEKITGILTNIKNQNLNDVLLTAKKLEEYKENFDEVLDIAYLWFKDILIYKETKNESFITDKTNISAIKDEALLYSAKAIYNNLTSIENSREFLRYNSNFQMTAEVMLLSLKGVYEKV